MSYGQYSGNGGERLTLSDLTPIGAREAKKAGHNRATYTRNDGVRAFKLLRTEVVTYDPASKVITVSTGGWSTMTTRKAIEEGFEALGLTATHHPGYVGPNGETGFPPPGANWAFRPVKTPGLLPPGTGARAWGARKKGDDLDNGFYLGRGGPWSEDQGDAPAPIRVRFDRSLKIKVGPKGRVKLIEVDGGPPPRD